MNIAIITAMPEETRACLKAVESAEFRKIGGLKAFRCHTPQHVAVCTGLCVVTGGLVQQIPVEVAAAALNFVARQSAAGIRVFASLFAGTQSIMAKREIAPLLPLGAPCPVVEMESAAIAIVAGENGIPFLGIRTVSDPADEELGFSLEEFTDSHMRIRPHRIALTILRKPWIMPQLIRLARNSRIAADSLSHAVARLLASMST
jgi:adenosylhomocysteine nucleosidase